MEKQSKLTLTGFVVVIFVVAFWFLIIIPGLQKVKRIEGRVLCGTNLKGLGTAMIVYANDHDDKYPQLPGTGPWAKDLGFPFYLEEPDFESTHSNTLRTISSSLYLLVKETDVHPKSFICPWADQVEFDGSNPKNLSLIDLWDFGIDPYKHISYSYHNPYGNFPPDASRPASFAVMADMNPWFKDGNIIPPGKENLPPQIIKIPSKNEMSTTKIREIWKPSNTLNELPLEGFLGKKAQYSEGQNVLYADGHSAWEFQPNMGVRYDNIYTFWSTEENPSEQDRQGGTAPTSRGPKNDAKSEEDSFLVL